jgi:hypothetical protein
MTSISILPVTNSKGLQQYRASAGDKVSIGQTPGEALDAIYAQLETTDCNILIPNFQPDPDPHLHSPGCYDSESIRSISEKLS